MLADRRTLPWPSRCAALSGGALTDILGADAFAVPVSSREGRAAVDEEAVAAARALGVDLAEALTRHKVTGEVGVLTLPLGGEAPAPGALHLVGIGDGAAAILRPNSNISIAAGPKKAAAGATGPADVVLGVLVAEQPVAELDDVAPVLLRDAEDLGEHLHRDLDETVGDEVELLLLQRLVEHAVGDPRAPPPPRPGPRAG